jgi:serralysin
VLSADSIPTLLGETLGVNGLELVDKDPDIPNPELVATDIAATNGIAHVLDGVLIPADILNGDGGRGRVDFEIGDEGRDVFRTGANTDFVSGLGGNDDIRLGRGDDVGLGGDGSDRIWLGRGDDIGMGGSGNDLIQGGRGNDMIGGDDGNDVLRGGRGHDELDGGAGRDLLIGGRGDDLLTGGADDDIFRFNSHSGSDVITDFTLGEDLIQIRARGMRDFDDLEHRIFDSAEGAVIHVGGTDITLAGIRADSLTESDFQFT